MMPRQPVGVKPNTVPIPAVGATYMVVRFWKMRGQPCLNVQLPFRSERAISIYQKGEINEQLLL